MFKENEFEIMYMNKHVAYFKDYNEQRPSLNPPFSSVYICHKMLPKQIVFEEINKKKQLTFEQSNVTICISQKGVNKNEGVSKSNGNALSRS